MIDFGIDTVNGNHNEIAEEEEEGGDVEIECQ